MTLEEKVVQLGSRWIGNDLPESGGALGSAEGPEQDRTETLNVAPMQDVFARAGSSSLEEASRHGLGHLTRIYGSAPISAADGAAELVFGCASLSGVAAVDGERDADDEAGPGAAKPQDGSGDLFALAESGNRCGSAGLGRVEFTLGDHVGDHRGLDGARADSVAAR
jgi:hypothetical protein